jgi:tetratricopeptide (TPR) repeat protein
VLAIVLWRRHRGVSAGLLMIGVGWLPTSNLLFASGVVIAERTLYLASVGVALLVAEGVRAAAARWGLRRLVLSTVGIALILGARSASASRVWQGNRELVLHTLVRHPESYRAHQAAARALVRLGDLRLALAEYGVAIELFPLEHANLAEAGEIAFDAGSTRLALRYLLRAEELDPFFAPTERRLAYVWLRLDSARAAEAHARRAVAAAPRDPESARLLAAAFLALREPDSARAVWPAFLGGGGPRFRGWLYRAATFASVSMLDSARLAFDSARASAPDTPESRADLGALSSLILRSAITPPRSR